MVVTIREVARAAGVSITTVSRALATPDQVAAATRDRVVAAAEQLGYRPNRAASGLRAGRTSTIGLLVPDLSNPYFAAVSRGVAARARAHGVAVYIVDSEEDPQAEVELLRGLVQQTDGVVLCSPRATHEHAEALRTKPVVVANNQLPGARSVAIDDAEGIALLLEHLYALGHRRVVYAGGPARSWSDARRRAALSASATRWPDLEVVQLGAHPPTLVGGSSAAGVAVATGATAVITFNDIMAIGLLRWVQRLGLRVPHDLSVATFDNTYLVELAAPALTSVHGDLGEVGARAAGLLLDALASGRRAVDDAEVPAPADLLLLPTTLAVRDSTAPHLPGSGPGPGPSVPAVP